MFAVTPIAVSALAMGSSIILTTDRKFFSIMEKQRQQGLVKKQAGFEIGGIMRSLLVPKIIID